MKRIVGATAIPDRSPHPWGRRLLRGRGSLSDLAVPDDKRPSELHRRIRIPSRVAMPAMS